MIKYHPIVELLNTSRFLEIAIHNEQSSHEALKDKEAMYEKAKSDYDKAKQLYEYHKMERNNWENGLYNQAKEVLNRKQKS